MKQVSSIGELSKLSKGNVEDKKLAASYGYQPILDVLVNDPNEEVAKFAKLVNADDDLKLYKADENNEKMKSSFNKSYKDYMRFHYLKMIAVILGVLMEVIATIILLNTYTPSIWFWFISGIVLLLISIIFNGIANKKYLVYLATKNKLLQTNSIYEAAKIKFNNLTHGIENGYK